MIAKDKNGKEWDLSLTMAIAKRIMRSDYSEILGEENIPINLVDLDKRSLELLLSKDSLMVAVCYTIVYDQIGTDLSPEEREVKFLSLIDGEFKSELKAKLWESLVAFNPEAKEDLLNFKTKVIHLKEQVSQTLEEMSPELEKVLQQSVRNAITGLASGLKIVG